MKTLVVTLEYPPQIGGIANYIEQFLRYQPAEDVVVLAPYVKGDKENDARWPWKTIRTNPSIPFVWPHWLLLYFTTKNIIAAEKIDHLHVHHVLPVGYIAYHLKKKKKLAGYTVFLHGTDVLMMQQSQRKRKWFTRICTAADTVVVNSDYLKNKVTAFLPGVAITVVHPCPADYFFETVSAEVLAVHRAQLAISNHKTFLTVGRMVEGKGFSHLVRLLPKILEKVPNAMWLVVGKGKKQQELVDFVQKNGLQNAVRFLGYIPHEQLPALYQVADAFVMLTHPDKGVEESWGTVFLEAAASGLPVVAGRSGGVEEAVENTVTGLVVDTDHDEEVVSAIVTILTDTTMAKSFGKHGRVRAQNEFTWDKQLAKLN